MGGITKQQHFMAKQEEEYSHGYSHDDFGMDSGRGFMRGRGGGFRGGGRPGPYPMGGRGGFAGGQGRHPVSFYVNISHCWQLVHILYIPHHQQVLTQEVIMDLVVTTSTQWTST